jgi:hypothetical protein
MPLAERPSQSEKLDRSSHTIFFGTDDITAFKKEEKEITAEESDEVEFKETNQSQEWKELCAVAQDVFGVYFSTDESHLELERSKEQKKKRIYTRINGTMPWLSEHIKSLSIPGFMTALLLFTEASLRGIGQVFFQNNPLSGLFILVAMFLQSSRVAVHGIIALVIGNMAGLVMGFDKSFVSCGEKFNDVCNICLLVCRDMN